jgi:hypothetical protein
MPRTNAYKSCLLSDRIRDRVQIERSDIPVKVFRTFPQSLQNAELAPHDRPKVFLSRPVPIHSGHPTIRRNIILAAKNSVIKQRETNRNSSVY